MLINYGEDNGKLAVVADIVDGNRVLLDGPKSGVAREVYSVKRISVTDLKVNVLKGARTGTIRTAWEKEEVCKKWGATAWGKKLASQRRRAELNDFERFNAMVLKKRLNFQIRHPNGFKKAGKK